MVTTKNLSPPHTVCEWAATRKTRQDRGTG